jgi:hypothetical protein
MTDPEGFLSRWSRRKREAVDDGADQPALDPADPTDASTQALSAEQETGVSEADAEEKKESKAAEPAFDISKLPAIESITADTDIRPFLAPGVPPALTQAALRRVWVADPRIRDFIEIAENQWDFTAPGVPGFDLSPPTGDIARMLAQVLPSQSPTEPTAEEKDASREPDFATADDPHCNVNEPAQVTAHVEQPGEENSAQPTVLADNESGDGAVQKNSAARDERPVPRRGHGSAMPR